MSPRPAILLLSLALVVPTAAAANTFGCGEDAFSSAQVVERRAQPGARPSGRGPITAGPDTLCADLSDSRRPINPDINVVIAPGSQGGNGDEAGQPTLPQGRLPGPPGVRAR